MTKPTIYEIDGIAKPFKQWCEEVGLKSLTVYMRMKRGHTLREALTWELGQQPETRNHPRDGRYEFQGRVQTMTAWCKELGVAQPMVSKRLKKGWAFADAVTIKERSRIPGLSFPTVEHARANKVWRAMMSRCDNKTDQSFAAYGGRGIKYESRWKKFDNFLFDMGDPAPGLSLERINVNGNYTKKNCRWATSAEQARNKRNSLTVRVNGKTRPLKDACESLNIHYDTVLGRLKRGWSVDHALSTKANTKQASSYQPNHGGHRTTHGMSRTSTFAIWSGLRQRCSNPNHPRYKDYGGRGISYDPRWDDFETFLADMGERPLGKTLDRTDNDLGYSKDNCAWIDAKQQSKNRRASRLICIDGETKILAEWLKFKEIPGWVYHRRIKNGMNPEQALQSL